MVMIKMDMIRKGFIKKQERDLMQMVMIRKDGMQKVFIKKPKQDLIQMGGIDLVMMNMDSTKKITT